MSLEVTSNIENPKVSILYSNVAELIAIINVLADSKHHASVQKEVENLSRQLSSNSKKFLQKVAGLPYQGIEFFELLLDCRIFNNIDEFTTTVHQYDNKRFIHVLTGSELDDRQIDQLMEDKQALPQWLNDFPWVYRGNPSVFESLLYDTQKFKDDFTELIYEVHKIFFVKMEDKLKNKYEFSLKALKHSLSKNSISDVSEKIMNRKIELNNSIKEIFFLPSYYINPHYVMAYNCHSRMFLYDMKKEDPYSKNHRQKLSAKLKILSDETRLEILRLLILQPTYGKLLSDRLHLTTATISHHLDVLSSAHLITESREKNTKYFSANEKEIDRLIAELNNYLYNK